jgi:hypothetical protein
LFDTEGVSKASAVGLFETERQLKRVLTLYVVLFGQLGPRPTSPRDGALQRL